MKKNKLKDKEFKVEYEYVETPDAEERLNRAFDILFNETLLRRKNGDNKTSKA